MGTAARGDGQFYTLKQVERLRLFWSGGLSEGSGLIWKGHSMPGALLSDPNMDGDRLTHHTCSCCPSLLSILDKEEHLKLSVNRRHIFDKLRSIAISNGWKAS